MPSEKEQNAYHELMAWTLSLREGGFVYQEVGRMGRTACNRGINADQRCVRADRAIPALGKGLL